MPINFCIATSNQHKLEEFQKLFDPQFITLTLPPQPLEIEESGATYYDNALLKAEGYYQKLKMPILTDDSGLNVEALPDELAVKSARFGGPAIKTDKERALLLLKKLEGEKNRNAFFTCVLCFYFSPKEIYFFEGRFQGTILHSYSAENGFGYDPIFCPESHENLGIPVSELPELKLKSSHRALATQKAMDFFKVSLQHKFNPL